MIPLRDSEPSGITPYVTIGLMVLNILGFLLQLSGGDELIDHFGLRPAILVGWIEGKESISEPEINFDQFDPPESTEWNRFERHAPREYQISLADAVLPLFLSMFLHAGFLHIIGNMLFLWIFGDNVEARLGHLRFLLFYIICGVAAGLVHCQFSPDSLIPTIGASGAVAGVLGAYWFCFPHSLVTVLFWFFIYIRTFQIRASWFLGIWVGFDILKALNDTGGNVAVWAHIGGFFAGLGLVILMTPKSARGKRPTRWSVIR
ncbi:MAG: rhomboid family intramembrane serine protease [Planctomycetota bacterium]|nr:rhomboid family intramembrane serine protease [Planctomycetota bacterium]